MSINDTPESVAAAATRSSRIRALVSLLAGTVFGVGLSVAQMTDPRKVLGFLDLAGDWDPSLLLVLGAAVLPSAFLFHYILRAPRPQFGERFHLPTVKAIDRSLIVGSALFGVGWGLAGYCPGPAIASLGVLNPEALWIVPAIVAGALLQRFFASH